jgi:transposase
VTREFTAEFKASTVALFRMGEKSIYELAKDPGLPEKSIRNWVRRADIEAGAGPVGALTTDERKDLERLRRENKVLQMERENLKNERRPSSPERAGEVLVHPGAEGLLSDRVVGPRAPGVAQWLR